MVSGVENTRDLSVCHRGGDGALRIVALGRICSWRGRAIGTVMVAGVARHDVWQCLICQAVLKSPCFVSRAGCLALSHVSVQVMYVCWRRSEA